MSVIQSIAINATRKKFRDLIRSDRFIRAPGVVDPISAKLVEAAGFDAVYVTGGGIPRSNRIVGLHEKRFFALASAEGGQ